MRGLVTFCVAIGLLLAVFVEGIDSKQVCKPNTVFKKGNAICKCNSSGTKYTCHVMSCPPNNAGSCEPSETNEKKLGDIACTPGSLWTDGCLECWCDQSGTAGYCTTLFCPRPQ